MRAKSGGPLYPSPPLPACLPACLPAFLPARTPARPAARSPAHPPARQVGRRVKMPEMLRFFEWVLARPVLTIRTARSDNQNGLF